MRWEGGKGEEGEESDGKLHLDPVVKVGLSEDSASSVSPFAERSGLKSCPWAGETRRDAIRRLLVSSFIFFLSLSANPIRHGKLTYCGRFPSYKGETNRNGEKYTFPHCIFLSARIRHNRIVVLASMRTSRLGRGVSRRPKLPVPFPLSRLTGPWPKTGESGCSRRRGQGCFLAETPHLASYAVAFSSHFHVTKHPGFSRIFWD